MKSLLIIILFFIVQPSFGQVNQDKNLYDFIDSLINDNFSIKFEYSDSISQRNNSDTINLSPEPLIILDGLPIEKVELKKHILNEIENIEMLSKIDAETLSFLGTKARNGVIIILTKEGKKQLDEQDSADV